MSIHISIVGKVMLQSKANTSNIQTTFQSSSLLIKIHIDLDCKR